MQRRSDEQRLISDDDDDAILSSESFVPAVVYHNADYEDSMQQQGQDEVVLLCHAPDTGGAFTYFAFYLLGIGTMTPWNFFVTAEEYWKYKFRNITLNDSSADAQEELTPLQRSFTCDLTLTATISGTTFLILNAVYGRHLSLRAKMFGNLLIILILFGVTTAFVEIDTDHWQEQFFLITMVMVVVLNICSATMGGDVYGMAGLFPSEYMTAVVSGQALCGIFTALAFILVLAFGTSPKTTAFIYFTMGMALILICIISFAVLTRCEFFKYYLTGGDKYKVISARPTHSQSEHAGVPLEPILRQVLGKIYVYVVCIILLYSTTLSVYPAVSVLMQSEYAENHTEWSDVYYLPVVNYLFFNCGDYIGRFLAGWFELPTNSHTALLMTFLRTLFVPFFLCGNSSLHYFLPVLIKHDATFMLMMSAFAISNGYLTNILLILVPRRVQQHEKLVASSIMAASLSLGMAIGSMLSMAFVQML